MSATQSSSAAGGLRTTWPQKNTKKNELLLGAIRAALEAGWRLRDSWGDWDEDSMALSDVLKDVDLWSFDVHETKEKKTAKARPAAKKTPPKPELSNDLASAAFDPECCKARFWNQKDEGDLSPDEAGHGMQCWRSPSVDGYCMKCLEKKGNPDSRTSTSHWFGDFDKPLTESPGEKKDGTPLEDWLALKKLKPKKAAPKKTTPKKTKTDKKEMKKALKKKKKKKSVVEEPVVEEPVVEEPVVEEPVAPAEDLEIDDNNELVEEHDDHELGLDDSEKWELGQPAPAGIDGALPLGYEVVKVNGFTLYWNKATNQLRDPDDGEVMGTRVADEAGEWADVMVGTDSDSSSEDEEAEEEEEEEEQQATLELEEEEEQE